MTWASKYFDIPFVDRGSTRCGCDCWGLVTLIYREQLDIKLPLYPEIVKGDLESKWGEITRAAASSDWLTVKDPQEFDVVLMKGLICHQGKKMTRPIHVGVVTCPDFLVHIESGSEVTIANYKSHPRVKRRVVNFFRHSS